MNGRSDGAQQAERIIAEVVALLDEKWIARHLDGPIDDAFRTFRVNPETPVSFEGFMHTLSELLVHLHHETGSCLFFPEKVAFAEVVRILELTYQGGAPNGYEMAYLDARNPALGMGAVLKRTVEGLKAVQRQKHMHWVFVTHISACDWPVKCQIVEAIKKRWGLLLPQSIREIPPQTLSNEIPDLIMALCRAQMVVNRICTGVANFHRPETTA